MGNHGMTKPSYNQTSHFGRLISVVVVMTSV